MSELLRAEKLAVAFGGLRAVDQVDLSVASGELVGLIGANGAGKTTLVDAVTGFVTSSGRILLDGTEISALPAHRRARAGIARTWQGEELFQDLTVYENVQVAGERMSLAQGAADLLRPRRHTAVPAVDLALERLGLADLGRRKPAELSQAHRKLVGVARALASEPKVVCMDEPAAGLGAGESRSLGAQLRTLLDDDTGILLIDHDMSLVLGVCDHVYVLEFGKLIAHGSPDEVRRDPRVIASYLGETANQHGALT